MYFRGQCLGLTYVISESNAGAFTRLKVIMFFKPSRQKDQRLKATMVVVLGGFNHNCGARSGIDLVPVG
jgi:hypothetical protein